MSAAGAHPCLLEPVALQMSGAWCSVVLCHAGELVPDMYATFDKLSSSEI